MLLFGLPQRQEPEEAEGRDGYGAVFQAAADEGGRDRDEPTRPDADADAERLQTVRDTMVWFKSARMGRRARTAADEGGRPRHNGARPFPAQSGTPVGYCTTGSEH